MGTRLKEEQIAERSRLKEAMIDFLNKNPEGCFTVAVADAVGCSKGLAAKLLMILSKEGRIGRKLEKPSPHYVPISLWLSDPGQGVQECPRSASHSRRKEACGFEPYENFHEAHELWMQRVRSPQPKANPWGVGS
jgi:hypothetical protein